MSQPATAADAFVPFDPAVAPPSSTSAAPGTLKVLPKAEARPAFTPFETTGPPHSHASGTGPARPVITLQREGERVTGIRIECICGQVIELACSY